MTLVLSMALRIRRDLWAHVSSRVRSMICGAKPALYPLATWRPLELLGKKMEYQATYTNNGAFETLCFAHDSLAPP